MIPQNLLLGQLEEEPIVVETTLEAEDGNGEEITDGDSTTSNDIEFTFSGAATGVAPEDILEQGFECTLDEELIDDVW